MKAYIGIDAGSTFTKYCVLDEKADILELLKKPTLVKENNAVELMLNRLREKYADVSIAACGYGRDNFRSDKKVSELIALAKGLDYAGMSIGAALDIGGQDTKAIGVNNGRLKEFYMNDKCAAGSGIFLMNTLRMLDSCLEDIDLSIDEPPVVLSSTCAVFAQTEIVHLMAGGATKSNILNAVIHTILTQAYSLLKSVEPFTEAALTGGFANIKNIDELFFSKFGIRLIIPKNGDYLSAIGCALTELQHKREGEENEKRSGYL